MDRLISEKQVLDAVDKVCRGSVEYRVIYDRCEELIKAIPSAEEPREVLYSGDGYADGEIVYDMAECPNCGYEYEDYDKDWGLPFCPNCGQALKWEGEEE